VSRAGAYGESLRAAQRARAAGFRVGANVFVTTANLPQLDALGAALAAAGVEETAWAPASFYPTARGRRNERLRPILDRLRPVAPAIAGLPGARLDRAKWQHLEAHTEAAYVARTLAGTDPELASRPLAGGPALVVRPNLDLYAGAAGRYRERLGNLRADGVAPLLRRALAGDWYTEDAVWFDLDPVPPTAELAATFGDAAGQGVHFWAGSARALWLDRAQRAGRSG
jgi:MoaA/NifB/PqqE/SkfB family radical SAM enzyme